MNPNSQKKTDLIKTAPESNDKDSTAHGQIKCRAAVESSIALLLKTYEHAKCDCDGVSNCVRCNAVFLSKSVREMLEAPEQPWIEEELKRASRSERGTWKEIDLDKMPNVPTHLVGHNDLSKPIVTRLKDGRWFWHDALEPIPAERGLPAATQKEKK